MVADHQCVLNISTASEGNSEGETWSETLLHVRLVSHPIQGHHGTIVQFGSPAWRPKRVLRAAQLSKWSKATQLTDWTIIVAAILYFDMVFCLHREFSAAPTAAVVYYCRSSLVAKDMRYRDRLYGLLLRNHEQCRQVEYVSPLRRCFVQCHWCSHRQHHPCLLKAAPQTIFDYFLDLKQIHHLYSCNGLLNFARKKLELVSTRICLN